MICILMWWWVADVGTIGAIVKNVINHGHPWPSDRVGTVPASARTRVLEETYVLACRGHSFSRLLLAEIRC